MAAARKEGQHPTENRRKKRLEELSLSPGIQRERETILNALRPLTELLSTVVGPNVEVVLHDLTKPEASIVAIANGYISRRSVGDSILSGPRQDKGFASAKLKLTARGQLTYKTLPSPYEVVCGVLALLCFLCCPNSIEGNVRDWLVMGM